MRRNLSRFRLLVTVVSLQMFLAAHVQAEHALATQTTQKTGLRIVKAQPIRVNQPLRSKAALKATAEIPSAALTFQDRRLTIPKTLTAPPKRQRSSAALAADAAVQGKPLGAAMPTADASFEGTGNVSGVLPPDTQGDIGWDPASGIKYYVQWVNLAYQIWDVTNPAAPVSLVGPVPGNTLWSGTGGLCDTHNDGDPLTRFDHLSKRWVMSQFALSFPNDFHQCIAVSASADPTGAWYLYDFQTSTTLMNDYGKLGLWPDGYYMSFNQFDGNTEAWRGAGVAVFERDKMLMGEDARMVYIDTGAVTLNYGGMLPADLDGPAPPAGTPNYFMEWDDSSWLGDPTDSLRIWEFKTDWSNPANTTFGLNTSYDPNLKISTADVDPNVCAPGARSCIPQPGTAQGLDAMSDRLMYRLQYRNFGTHQTIVGNHTVDASGSGQAGIDWFELRNPGSGFALYQQGTYAPDTDNRWMGSAAMDASGNIGLGYSVASSLVYPSVRYSGRLAGDPQGTLPQGEQTLIDGSGSQTHTAARWGDYSMLAVDPADGCTFWYTQEYMQTTGSSNWQTRIGAFRFPTCTTAPTGTLAGTVTDSAATPIAGATIDISGGYRTSTDAAGRYSLALTSGTYSLTVSKYGYTAGLAPAVTVTAPDTTTGNFTLAAAPSATISGVIRDATTAWPLYARIEIAGFPGSPVFTNPLTGSYHVVLAEGSYPITVTAMSGGYTAASQQLSATSDAIHNMPLTANTLTCSAPGYQIIPGSIISSDGFDTATVPDFSASWAQEPVSGTSASWVSATTSEHPNGIAPHSGSTMAVFNSWTAAASDSNRLYLTDDMDLSAQGSGEVSFWMYHENEFSAQDAVQVQISINDGVSWNNVGAPVARQNNTNGWAKHTVNINAYTGAGMSDVRIGLLGISQWGNDIHLDSFAVSAASQCVPLADGGLVIGTVRDANTGALAPNATVRDVTLNAATIIDAAADPAVPARMYVIGQPAGVRTLTATAPSYGSGQSSPTVVAGGTIRQDILLSTGQLSVAPASLTFNLTTEAPTAALPLNLDNSGGRAGLYEIFTVPGTFAGYAPAGPFAAHTRHTGPKNLNDRDAAKLRVNFTPKGITALAAGEISNSLATGLSSPWGIGFNSDANDYWLGNFDNKVDYRFTTAGVNTGETIDTSPWAVTFAADMTYNPFTNTLWQVNVGGDNCIYELNPTAQAATGNKICPAFGTSQRGLAFDPLSNSYYSGSWSDGIINHFAPDGTMLDSTAVGLNISGLAFNPGSGHLFVMTNAATASDPTAFDVYVLDTKAAYAILGGFNLNNGGANAFSDNAQAALELDCSGNLWAVDQAAKQVHVASSGENGVCAWQANWLSVAPANGSVAAGTGAALTASVNATGLPPGIYTAYLRIANDSPYGAAIVPVTLYLAGMNQLGVTKSGSGAGTVTSTPGGINCGGDCTELYPPNTVVRLTAVPASGSSFTGWDGNPDCSDGLVTLDAAKSCSASFTLMSYVITESVVGGNGSMSCTSPVAHGSDSTCTITPAFGYQLATFTDEGVDAISSLIGNSYTIHAVTAAHLVAGTFAPIPPLRIPAGTIQGAYNTVIDTGSIQAQSQTFTEDVICNRPITVQFKGGYTADYAETSGMTTIQGSLRVRTGKVTVARMRIKK